MKKPIRFDLEDQTTGPLAPPRRLHATAMIVVSRRRSKHGEGAEAMLAFHHRCRAVELRAIQRLDYCQLARPSKWGSCFVVRADVVTIAPRNGTIACVKLRTHLVRGSDPHVFW
jgi:hypothetical protein